MAVSVRENVAITSLTEAQSYAISLQWATDAMRMIVRAGMSFQFLLPLFLDCLGHLDGLVLDMTPLSTFVGCNYSLKCYFICMGKIIM